MIYVCKFAVSFGLLVIIASGCANKIEQTPVPLTPPFNQSGSLLGSDGNYPDEKPNYVIYRTVVNHEEQFSIWPADRELPLGWSSLGFIGGKTACLQYIEDIWEGTTQHTFTYQILKNQGAPRFKYIIWDLDASYGFPPGYSAVGYTGIDSDCIEYIQARNPS